MKLQDLEGKWKNFVVRLNENGILLPMVHDPKTKTGSVTLTLVVMSSGLCGLAVVFMLATAVTQLASDFTLTPQTSEQIKNAFASSFQFLIASLSAYLGRKFQRDDKGGLTVESKAEEKADGQ